MHRDRSLKRGESDSPGREERGGVARKVSLLKIKAIGLNGHWCSGFNSESD